MTKVDSMSQVQKEILSSIRDGKLSKPEADEVERLGNFFWEEGVNGKPRWENLPRLWSLARGCRERWLHGELCLAGYGIDSQPVDGGMADFCYPQNMDPIEPRVAPYPSDGKPDLCFPYTSATVVGELKFCGTQEFAFKGKGEEQLALVRSGKVLGKGSRGRKDWGLLEDYFRLRQAKIPALRLLVVVIAIEKPSSDWNVWGKLVMADDLNFHESIQLPDLVNTDKLRVRIWKVLPEHES